MSTVAAARPDARTQRPATINWAVLTQLLAAVAAFSMPARVEFINGVTIGTLVGIALLPVWWGSLRRFRGARTVMALAVLALITGTVLTLLFADGREVSRPLLQGNTGQFLLFILGVGVALWVRRVLGPTWLTVWWSAGLILDGLIHPTQLGIPWKYDFGFAVTLIVLALAARRGPRPLLEIPLAILMAGTFAVSDARSLFGLVVLAAMACALQAVLPPGSGRSRDTVLPVAALALAGFAVYRLVMWAIAEGFLGEAARQRTVTQLAQSGNVLTSGRPEMGASIELITARPWGYGHGLLANRTDLAEATQGMALVSDRMPDPGYVRQYMLDYGFTMHSFGAETWIRHGIPGLVLVLVLAVLLVVGLLRRLAHRRLTVVVAFAAVNSLWNILFSPTTDTIPQMVIALALVLGSREHSDADDWRAHTWPTSPVGLQQLAPSDGVVQGR